LKRRAWRSLRNTTAGRGWGEWKACLFFLDPVERSSSRRPTGSSCRPRRTSKSSAVSCWSRHSSIVWRSLRRSSRLTHRHYWYSTAPMQEPPVIGNQFGVHCPDKKKPHVNGSRPRLNLQNQ
jgi:hypothetical protein